MKQLSELTYEESIWVALLIGYTEREINDGLPDNNKTDILMNKSREKVNKYLVYRGYNINQ